MTKPPKLYVAAPRKIIFLHENRIFSPCENLIPSYPEMDQIRDKINFVFRNNDFERKVYILLVKTHALRNSTITQ